MTLFKKSKRKKKNLQGIQPSRTSKADIVPTGHDVHAEDLTTLVLPPAQFVHSDLPTKENVPGRREKEFNLKKKVRRRKKKVRRRKKKDAC